MENLDVVDISIHKNTDMTNTNNEKGLDDKDKQNNHGTEQKIESYYPQIGGTRTRILI